MQKFLPKYFEFRLFAWLGSLALTIYFFNLFAGALNAFSDLIVTLLLSWLLAFVLDPLVEFLIKKSLSRLQAVITVYLGLTILITAIFSFVIPAIISQLSTLAVVIPGQFGTLPGFSGKFEGIIGGALNNSVTYIQTLASFVFNLLLVVVISFYLLLSRNELEKFMLKIIPDKFEEDYLRLKKILNTTFASFLRAQLLIGLLVGGVTIVVLAIFSIEFALSVGILAGIMAMIPVVGPILSLIPPVLAAATISPQKGLVAGVTLFLIYQLIYNIIAPKILGSALKIHPVFVILAFLVGYKLAGPWGAIFAVPVAVSLGIIIKEIIFYWKEEADKAD